MGKVNLLQVGLGELLIIILNNKKNDLGSGAFRALTAYFPVALLSYWRGKIPAVLL